MRPPRTIVALSGLAALAAVGALWFFFAPTQLGGRVDYAVIYGTSMEPSLHRGDLAVLRARPSYSVGEVVGYKNGDLKRVVLHRIIGRHGSRFVFKGDNNQFVDSFEPASNQVVGRLWLRVPAVGNVLLWLHTPRNSIVVGALAALLLAGGGLGAGAGTRRRRSPERARVARGSTLALGRPVAIAGAAGVLGFGLAGLVGFAHPTTRAASDGNAYLQHLSFGFTGAAPAGAVYPDGRVRTGDTVFTKLVHRLTFTADYRFDSALPHVLRSRAKLVATLESQQGLSRMFPLDRTRTFTGDRWRGRGTLDLDGIRAAIDGYERSTGVLGDTYTIDVSALVYTRGAVGGESVQATFAPTPVTFSLDAMKLKLVEPVQTGAADAPPPDPLHVTASGSVMRRAPAALSFGPLHVGVTKARTIGLIGAAGSLVVALLGLGLLLGRGQDGGDELSRILRKYDSWIIQVASPLGAAQVVELTTIESLGRLAEYYDRAILHHADGGAHTFAIEREGTLYCYRLGGEVRRLEAVPAVAPPVLTLTKDSR